MNTLASIFLTGSFFILAGNKADHEILDEFSPFIFDWIIFIHQGLLSCKIPLDLLWKTYCDQPRVNFYLICSYLQTTMATNRKALICLSFCKILHLNMELTALNINFLHFLVAMNPFYFKLADCKGMQNT